MTRFDRARPLLPLGYMLALFALSAVPGNIPGDTSAETPAGAVFQWIPPEWQNLLHIPLYAGLVLSWLWALARYPLTHRNRLIVAFTISMLWGVIDEIHQAGVPGRYGSLTDVTLNLLGAALAVVWARYRRKATM